MAATTHSALMVGRTESGCCLKIQGRGTMKESPAAHEFAISSLDGGVESLVVDLFECTYLDSTFLGCLIELHRRFNRQPVPRFLVAANAAKVKQLLFSMHLDRMLKILPAPCTCIGDCVPLPITAPDELAFSRHVMECHRRLAEIESPHQAKFAKIADQMARELRDAASLG